MKFNVATVYVKDMEKSIAFYRDVLGMKLQSRRQGGGGNELAFLGEEDQPQIELVCSADSGNTGYAGFSLGFSVEDMDTALDAVKAKGYETVGMMQPNPSVKIAHIYDPNGITISFIQQVP
jgi:predicted enzyme related to lactoylglutathione lyase